MSAAGLRAIILSAAVGLSAAAGSFAATPAATGADAPVWEHVDNRRTATAADDAGTAAVELKGGERTDISVRDGIVYIVTDAPLKVEVYSILGQRVTQRQLQPGTSRLTLPRRGLYILKAGAVTRRINI